MTRSTEIERKFLLRRLPDGLDGLPGVHIVQGYLSLCQQSEVRVRQAGSAHSLTVKIGAGLERGETEIALSKEQFESLWPLTDGKRVEKTRYYERHGEYVIEFDVYHGRLEGLLIAEIEFDTVDESARFEPAGLLGDEVTGDVRYANRNLAVNGPPNDH